jgi:uncharacterized protein
VRRRKTAAAPPRVVLDTNVALSTLVFSRGRLAWVREAWQQQRLIPLVSRPTAEELLAVLAYPKFKLTAEDQQELLADYLPWCETVTLPERLPALPECRDPDDQKFLVLAAIAQADALITDNADLLALQAIFPIPILDPESFRQRLLQP